MILEFYYENVQCAMKLKFCNVQWKCALKMCNVQWKPALCNGNHIISESNYVGQHQGVLLEKCCLLREPGLQGSGGTMLKITCFSAKSISIPHTYRIQLSKVPVFGPFFVKVCIIWCLVLLAVVTCPISGSPPWVSNCCLPILGLV